VSIALAVALILQAAFFIIWIMAASPASLAYVLIALAAFAMGLQANAMRSLHVPGISTTAFSRVTTAGRLPPPATAKRGTNQCRRSLMPKPKAAGPGQDEMRKVNSERSYSSQRGTP
jgi:Protein of unknown function (DUF1275)